MRWERTVGKNDAQNVIRTIQDKSDKTRLDFMTVGYIIALYSTGVSTFGYDNGIVHGRDRCVGKADREEINTEGQYKRRG